MGLLQPDLTEAIDLTPISEGTYKGKIIEAKAELSREKKTPMCVTKFAISVDEGKPRTRKAYITVSGEGAGAFDQLLRACHFDDLADKYKDPNVQPKPSFDTDQLVGQELNIIIVPDLYQKTDGAGNNVGSPELRDKIKGYLKL